MKVPAVNRTFMLM